jgi:hypothetical protein
VFLKPITEDEIKSVVKYLNWELLAVIDEVGDFVADNCVEFITSHLQCFIGTGCFPTNVKNRKKC